MKKLTFSLFLLMSSFSFSQKVIVKNSLQIEHGDIKLYLDDDTCTMVSKHTISWKEFQKIGTYSRSEKWFDDKYTGKYLTKCRVKIPTHYFKILYIGKKNWVWIGENVEDKNKCIVKSITLTELNSMIKKNSMRLIIK